MMNRPLVAAALLGISIVGCAARSDPSRKALDEVLRLEMHLDSTTLQLGTRTHAHLTIRNISHETVDYCWLDGGVSIGFSRPKGLAPLVVHASVLHAPCYQPTRLRAGDTHEFSEDFNVVFMQPGPNTLIALIRMHYPQTESVRFTASPVDVTILLR